MSDRQAVWCLAFGQTFVWAGVFYIFPALIIWWEADFGWSRSEITAALTFAVFASAIFSPISGALIDRGLGSYTLPIGTFIGGLLVACLFFVNSLVLFYLIWTGLGVCMAFSLYEPCFSFVIKTKGLQAKRYITHITLVAGLAGTIAFPVVHFVSELAGWRAVTLVFVMLVSCVAAPLMWVGTRYLSQDPSAIQGVSEDHAKLKATRYSFLRWPKFWLVAAAFAFLIFSHTTLINHLLLILNDRQFDPGTAVLAISFIGPMQVVGRLLIMIGGKYISDVVAVFLCFAFAFVAIICLMLSAYVPAFLILFIILHGSGNGVISILKPIISREILGGDNFGLKSGVQAVPYLIGSAFAALIGSLLWNSGGYDLVLNVLLVVLFSGALSLALAVRLNRQTVKIDC